MIQSTLDAIHSRYVALHRGRIATYIPELGKADPSRFGIALATTRGEVFETGDTDLEFTIQSISKIFVYALALDRLGERVVAKTVGVEPSGDAYNSIVLKRGTGRPFNAMVNAGAIAATALLQRRCGCTAGDFVELFGRAAGRALTVDATVCASEKATGHRNRAIAYLMLNSGVIAGDVEEILNVYFQQCSVRVTVRDLAVMAATLANHGTNPVTGERVFSPGVGQAVMSVMLLCGMYDFSGEWAYRTGMPAKSGVSGGILAVVNRQLGIGVHSPPLDQRGNSVRGIRVCEDLAHAFDLHVLNAHNHGSNFLQTLIAGSTPGTKPTHPAAMRVSPGG